MLRDTSKHIETSPPQPLQTKRLLISEEGLIDEVGHWYEYCKAVNDIHADRGIECLVAMHVDAKPEVRTDLKALAVYSRTIWGTVNSQTSSVKRYLRILSHNLLVYRTMDRLIRRIGPFDIVFAPTVTIHHLIGWRLFSARHIGRDCNRVVLLFRNNIGYYTPDSKAPKFRKAALVLAPVLKSFAPLIKAGTVVFATDSDRLAIEYEALCGLRPIVFPSPRVAETQATIPSDSTEVKTGKSSGGIVFSCLGPARFEKGIDILQEATKLVLARRPSLDISFVIQWNSEVRDAMNIAYVPDPALMADRRVRFLTKSLTSDEYNREISNTDCMVLPYRRDNYFARISGVAVEGVTAGKPIIYTLDTWCEELVKKSGAGIGMPDGDIEGLARAIEEIADNFSLYREQALAKVEEARSSNSADVFFEKLWGSI